MSPVLGITMAGAVKDPVRVWLVFVLEGYTAGHKEC